MKNLKPSNYFLYFLLIAFFSLSWSNTSAAQSVSNIYFDFLEIEETPPFSESEESSEDYLFLIGDELNKLSELETKIDVISATNPAKDWLYSLIHKRMLQCRLFEAPLKNNVVWCDLNEVGKINNHIFELKEISSRNKSFRALLQAFNDPDKISRRDLRQLNIFPIETNEEEVRRIVWAPMNEGREELINEAELFSYQAMTPDKTALQLEYFISNSSNSDYHPKSVDEYIYNQYADTAFLHFFEILTQDGEPETINSFLRNMNERKNQIWTFLLIQHQAFIDKRHQSSVTCANIINSSHPDAGELLDVIQNSGNKETAFVALQRLIRPELQRGNYDEALKIVHTNSAYFSGANTQKITDLSRILQLQSNDTTPLSFKNVCPQIVSPFSFELSINPRHSQLGVIFAEHNRKPSLLEVQTEDCKIIREGSLFSAGRFFTYNFRTQNINQTEEWLVEELSQFGGKAVLKTHWLKDMQIVWYNNDVRIAFFVTNSSALRMDLPEQPDCSNTEYPSVGLTQSFGFHAQQHGFHGKAAGNSNTDIYYSVKLNGNSAWSSPKLLTGMGMNNVNTPFSERSPYFTSQDGTPVIYFASEGHVGLGGYDIYSASLNIDTEYNISVSGAPKNYTDINSGFDELFYIANQYVESNRSNGRAYELFHISNTLVPTPNPIPTPNPTPVPIPVPDVPGKTPTIFLGDIGVEIICDTLEQPSGLGNDGRVPVKGRVVDNDGKPVKNADIYFQATNEDRARKYVIGRGTKAINYHARLEENMPYHVQVFAYTDSGDTIAGYVDNVIFACEQGIDQEVATIYNPKVESLQKTAVIDADTVKAATSKFSLFFETDAYEVLAIPRNKASIVRNFIDNWVKHILDVDYREYCVLVMGFASYPGQDAYNCKLSWDRAESAKRFLINLGIPESKIITRGIGETTRFNDENESQYKYYLDVEDYRNSEELKRQLNRRATITFLPDCSVDEVLDACK